VGATGQTLHILVEVLHGLGLQLAQLDHIRVLGVGARPEVRDADRIDSEEADLSMARQEAPE
jgi:hypothetical protein